MRDAVTYTYISVENPGKNNDAYLYTISSIKEILDQTFSILMKERWLGKKSLFVLWETAFPLQRHILLKQYAKHRGLTILNIVSIKYFVHVEENELLKMPLARPWRGVWSQVEDEEEGPRPVSALFTKKWKRIFGSATR